MAFIYFPIKGTTASKAVVSSNFGYRQVSGGSTYHHGVDLAYSEGTECVAGLSGTVVKRGLVGQVRGNYFVLNCGNYEPYGTVYLYYQHLRDAPPEIGAKFKQGDVCGIVGGTGTTQHSYGAHLHFGVTINTDNDYYRSTCARYDDYPTYTIGAMDPSTATWLGIDSGEDVPLNPSTGYNFSPYVIAAICGNGRAESTLNPASEEVGTMTVKGYGMFGWTGSRRTELEKYMRDKNLIVYDFYGQLDFLVDENVWLPYTAIAGNSQYNTLTEFLNSKDTSIYNLTREFMQHWENPKESLQTPAYIQARVDLATEAYNFIAEHKDDDSIKNWHYLISSSAPYLTVQQQLENAVLLYRYFTGGGGDVPTPEPVAKILKYIYAYADYLLAIDEEGNKSLFNKISKNCYMKTN